MARILLVEDNPVNQKLAASMLERFGHAVDVAGSGENALVQCAGHAYDVILMDIRMPGIDGFETTRRIRAGTVPGTRPDIPIVAMTAGDLADDQEACRAAGMDGFLAKPIQPLVLKETVEQVLARETTGATSLPEEQCAPIPAEEDGGVVWNFEKALARLGGDVPLAKRLIDLFLTEMPKNFITLQDGLASRDAQRVEIAAHSIKGACRNLEIVTMAAAALEVEKAAKSADIVRAAALVPAVESEFKRFCKEVAEVDIHSFGGCKTDCVNGHKGVDGVPPQPGEYDGH